ncbi:DNA repair protein RadC [Polynucleobacter sp. AP-Ainpum-60-G11]|uniref:RadC family protein n=1 Tax=Polynucleobacter sp. AP-Ainpum-60-G11 TaxID=2576926 RepID=UPI00352E45BE
MHSPITDWPKMEQPREKLRTLGAAALSDAELLAIFLRVGVKGKTAVALAEDLLHHFGNLPRLLSCTPAELTQIHGMGISKWPQIQAAYELVKRSLEETLSQESVFSSPAYVREFLQARFGRLPHEVFLCLYLDSRLHLIECQELFRGSLTHTAVYPREILKEALSRNASALIVAHNHPSGNPLPSIADQELTKMLAKALQLVDIPLLDHCIVSESGFFSFSDAGLMKNTLN